ncbi:hypothetical protein D3C79_495370 [compost metagenome]
MQQGGLAQAFAREAQAGFPGGVQCDRGQVFVQHGQQVLRQLPGTIAFAGTAFDPLAKHLVQLTQRLGGLALRVDVLQYAGEANALIIDELALAAAQQPARLQAIGLRDPKLHAVMTVTFRAHGMFHRLAHQWQVVGVDAGVEHFKAHFGAGGQAEQGLAAVIPQQQALLRAQVPGAHAGGVDGNASTCFDVRQGLFGAATALAFLYFAQGSAHGFGQQWQVLLQHIVGRAQADHFHRVLFAINAGQEYERDVGCQALGDGQHFGAG